MGALGDLPGSDVKEQVEEGEGEGEGKSNSRDSGDTTASGRLPKTSETLRGPSFALSGTRILRMYLAGSESLHLSLHRLHGSLP